MACKKFITFLFLTLFILTAHEIEGRRRPNRKRANTPAITIGAFNIQRLGLPKLENPAVRDIIVKIIAIHDIILIQEIVDKTNKTIPVLLQDLNEHHGNGKDVFDAAVSPRVGRSVAKEQYAYIFRKDKVRLERSFIYEDPNDHYEREPFVATFTTKSTAKGLKTFTFMGIHVKPSEAVAELQKLHETVEKLSAETTDDVIILGDFNAACDYVAKKYWVTIPLRTDEKYMWLIGNEADTTSTPSNCAYDRIVLRGERIQKAALLETAIAYKYDEIFKLPNELTLAISDHYPVQVRLSLSANRQKQ